MNRLFIDTNVFENIGYNFDLKNPIIKSLIRNAKSGEYKYYSLSVIDNEIVNHITDRCSKEYNNVRKIKWIKKYLDDEKIKENCYKDLNDYNQFKKRINSLACDVSSINPEIIFEKYFKIEYPFEKGDKKRKEFPDAFISAYLNSIKHTRNEKIFFISKDKGLKLSLNNNIITYSDLNTFLESMEKISPFKYNKIEEYVFNNKKIIQENLLKNMYIDIMDLEDEEIDIENLNIDDIIDIKIIDIDNNKYSINCKCNYLTLRGIFSCLDYNNSYIPNDCDFYAIQEYVKTDKLILNNYEFIIIINENSNGKYSMSFLERYVIQIDYNSIINSDCERIIPYEDYDGEGSFSQDNYSR